MQRRKFLKQFGVSSSAISILPGLTHTNKNGQRLPAYAYNYPKSLDEAKNEEGLIALRIAFSSKNIFLDKTFKSQVNIHHGQLARTRTFHFEYDDDQYNPQNEQFKVLPGNINQDILAIWISDATEDTRVTLKGRGGNIDFTLADLIQNAERIGSIGEIEWKANILLYNEIGEIDPQKLGISTDSDHFNFVAIADPQGGDPFTNKKILKTRMRIHNAFIEESVGLINEINCNPKFTMIIGDITDDWGAEEDFKKMNEFLKKVETPLLYSIGNHETLLRVKFEPGYNMNGFSNYFAAQRQVNGLEKLLYSFNLGQWHFVIWPDPLRPNFFETRPHYFDWLEQDLEKHQDRPTMFFQHVPLHPVGITPLINYTEAVPVKKEVLRIISKYGNVKYVLSGHVHIPLKASFKTAVTINGINFINLPAAGFRPRAFGEEDFNGGPGQGIAVVEIKGKDAAITFKTVTKEEYRYPDTLPKFDENLYSFWFNEKWEIPASVQFINGSFEDGLNGWGKRYVYTEDKNPSNICEVRKTEGNGDTSLYLFSKIRAYPKPGQDRWPQDINRVHQAITLNRDAVPELKFLYQIDEKNTDLDSICGAFVWIEGFSKTTKQFNLMYSIGTTWQSIGGNQGLINHVKHITLDITGHIKGWNTVVLNLADDFNRFTKDRRFEDLKVNRLIVNLGVWSGNDGTKKSYGAYFDEFTIEQKSTGKSSINNIPVTEIPVDQRWVRKNKHIAGEHWYIKDKETRFT